MANLDRLKRVISRGFRFVKGQVTRFYSPQSQVSDTSDRSIRNVVANPGPAPIDKNPDGPVISGSVPPEESISEEERNKRTAEHWSENTMDSDFFSSDNYWLEVPEVKERYNRKATMGHSSDWATYFLEKYIPNREEAVMASIGCGEGRLERWLAQNTAFAQCDAFDIAAGAIEKAKKAAIKSGFHHINYEVSDVNSMSLQEDRYDAIWFYNSLHHVSQLEHIYEQAAHALKPNGYLFFNEYIGPNRFNFTPRQRDVINATFALIPKRYKRSFVPGHNEPYLLGTGIPDPAEVARVDPSESVRSQEIITVLEDYFDIVEFNIAGGTMLQFLLLGIAGNFRTDDPESIRVLEMLFTVEDTLMEIGDLQSDFACVAATPKKHSTL